MGVRRRLVAAMSALGLMAALVPLGVLPAAAATGDLLISEYIEGSSNNKYIEIYNGTGAAIDLAAGGYDLQFFFNGSTSAGTTIGLTGSVADGDVYVVADDGAVLFTADQISTSNFFNGDDVVVLRKNGVVVDSFGQIGVDPGSEWSGGGQNDTLRRMASVCAGDTNPDDAFDASVEWVVFGEDDATGLGSHTADCGVVVAADPVINEFSASTTGTDVEYVEIYGSPDTDYSAYTVLEIEGDSNSNQGTIDEVIPVGTTDGNRLYLANLPANALENGSISLLLVSDFTGALGDDLDTDDDGVLDATPWTAVVDGVAVNDGGSTDLTYATPELGPNYDGISSFAPGGASRIPDGVDTDTADDWVRNDFDLFGIPGFDGTQAIGEAVNTPGASNIEITVIVDPVGACAAPATFIHDIQGSGLVSGDVGNIREIEGVVVGDFQDDVGVNGDLNGFNVQEEDADADGDPATSEGIFVFQGSDPAVDVALGDVVRVRGAVTEFNGLTEIGNVESVLVCGTGTATPATLTLPVDSIDDLEAFEGMSVTFPQALVISEYFNFDRFGEIVLTSERHLQPTAEFEPGSPEAAAAAADYLLDRITLDDGRTTQNPDPAIHPNGAEFTLDNLFRGGDTVANVTGVLDYAFGLYRVQPTQGGDYTSTNPRPATPDDVGGSIEVASFNVLNYFTTLDDGVNDICGPAGDQECRGADDAGEFTRQRDKIIAALGVMDSDIVGLIEIENHPQDVPTEDLVDGLNAEMGAGTYSYIETGAIGTDAIRVALIYKPDTVTPVGTYAVLDNSVDSRFDDEKNRPVLAQTFMDNTTGGIFTVAVNHLKSKGSACDDVGDPDTGDGSGNCNITRTLAAAALVDWLAGDPTESGDSDSLIIGDLNSYDKEDPIDVLLAGGFTDLLRVLSGESAYSYLFDGQTGYLDYSLASADLVGEITGVTAWHINADEADLIDYDTSFKQDAQDAIYADDPFRSSDHDPVITGLDTCDEIAPTFDELTVTPDTLWPANHKYVDVEVSATVSDNFDTDPTITLLSVESSEPDDAPGNGDGRTVDDIVVVDDFNFQLRAERAGGGEGRTYTITYEVSDDCGNSTIASVTVFVPHDQG